MRFEVGLIGIEHSIEPWEELLSTVVGVKDNWDAIRGRNGTDVVGSSNTALDGGKLALI